MKPRLLKAERNKLERMIPGLMHDLRFGVDSNNPDQYIGYSVKFRCMVSVHPFIERDSPWLACRFNRPKGERYADIPGANPFTGKYNCHIFERMTADDALEEFRLHLLGMIGFEHSVSRQMRDIELMERSLSA